MILIKNYPNLVFKILKTNLKDNYINNQGHLKFFDNLFSILSL